MLMPAFQKILGLTDAAGLPWVWSVPTRLTSFPVFCSLAGQLWQMMICHKLVTKEYDRM